ncbi:DNA polymerase III, delta subunit [Eubacterium ruminantium]|nr:DNA polymerase III, delta subunit [Eubacterium ruminantium]
MAGKKENPTENSIKTLNEHIKSGNFSHVYLLTGSEGYFITQYKHALLEALTSPDDTMNFTVFIGEKVTEEDIIEAISTMPFFADHRTVLVEATGLLSKAADRLSEAINDIPDTTRLIFVEPNADARLKIYKSVAKAGTVAKFETPDTRTLNIWLKKTLSSDGAVVDDTAVYALINAVGQDMNRLSNEAAKLRAFTLDKKTITADDVNILCENEAENKIFDMLSAISMHDSKKALMLYSDLETLKVAPMMTLTLAKKHFMKLATIKMMQKDKEENSAIAKQAGVHPFYLKDYLKQADGFTIEQLLHYAELCSDADYDIKSGKILEKNAVESVILHLCLD